MYIDADVIIKAAKLVEAVAVIAGVVIAVYKFCVDNKKQNAVIAAIQKEQTVLCYAVKGALEGLIEKGCDGPCKDALDKLNKHLNQQAHQVDL